MGNILSSGTRVPNLQIRRSGQVVQDRPLPVVGWADIPELCTRVGRRPVVWLQSRLQSRWNGANPRPSAFRPCIPQVAMQTCMCLWVPSSADDCRWLLLSLSPLLSAAGQESGSYLSCESSREWLSGSPSKLPSDGPRSAADDPRSVWGIGVLPPGRDEKRIVTHEGVIMIQAEEGVPLGGRDLASLDEPVSELVDVGDP